MIYRSTGRFKPVNGMLKIVVNGKQKIVIISSTILKRLRRINNMNYKMIIRKLIIRPFKKLWRFVRKND
jgi:hypothetical protein